MMTPEQPLWFTLADRSYLKKVHKGTGAADTSVPSKIQTSQSITLKVHFEYEFFNLSANNFSRKTTHKTHDQVTMTTTDDNDDDNVLR